MLWFKIAYCAFLMVIVCFACMEYGFSMEGEKGKMKVIAIALLVIFAGLVALKPLEVKDTYNYIDYFENSNRYLKELNKINLLSKYHGFECGYLLINALFYHMLPNYRWFFFVITLFSSFFSIKNLEEIRQMEFQNSSEYGFITMVIYMSAYAMSYLGVAIRAGLSVTLMLISYKYFCKKNYIVSTVFLFIAFTVQRSALCVVLLMVIRASGLKISKKVFLGIYSILLAMLFLNVGSWIYIYIAEPAVLFFQRFGISGYASYLITGTDQQIGLTDIWVCAAGFIICLLCNMKKQFETLYLSFLIAAIIIVFLHGARAVARLYEIFLFFSIPIYTEEIYMQKRKIGIWVLSVLLLGNFLVSMKTVF